ncbi:MAG: TrmH family RNA methyltransferase [Sphaerochaetaceae bacterium]|nr:TrmH family RNA methyltransferase [Sphaerochaetaceae bacterium]
MITIKKIETLKPRLKIRKVGELMHLAYSGEVLESEYIESLLSIVLSSELVSLDDKAFFERSFEKFLSGDLLSAEDIYFRVLTILGEEVADWDLLGSDGKLDSSKRTVLPHRLLLDRVRSPFNIGAIFRSAESLGVEHIYLREGCGDINSPRCLRTARGALDSVPHSIISSLDEVEGPLFALELGGKRLPEFVFPNKGVCVIGSEETGVSPDALALCSDRVSIPQLGAKGSLNVSVATGILLYSWSLS